MIQAHNLHKAYNQLEVLKGIDFTAREGEVVCIVGASGAGKSTLLHLLGTLDKPDKGTIQLKGVQLHTLNDKQLAAFRNEHLGFIFQFHHLLPEFTALENVCIPAFIAKKSKAEAEKRATELLDFLGLKSRLNHKPNELSGGEQQRVAVARALVNHPAVVFADEPSGNLDSNNARDLHQLFFHLRDTFRQTFVIVTHNDEFANLADRKVVMVDGRLL